MRMEEMYVLVLPVFASFQIKYWQFVQPFLFLILFKSIQLRFYNASNELNHPVVLGKKILHI